MLFIVLVAWRVFIVYLYGAIIPVQGPVTWTGKDAGFRPAGSVAFVTTASVVLMFPGQVQGSGRRGVEHECGAIRRSTAGCSASSSLDRRGRRLLVYLACPRLGGWISSRYPGPARSRNRYRYSSRSLMVPLCFVRLAVRKWSFDLALYETRGVILVLILNMFIDTPKITGSH
ncbi:hypothetical protein LX32DRAFT_311763 [Colletotrichum zoysiae]|uniref:Uncharacterized protein n=1 Tax=Colletotrichum zoysiae TaxID=1216348 RepID=A0AAD9H1B6_9PEZI|nr:hypothetical protein LX32DRAFT_311763 [Colletotrichum zoysiae]